MNSEQPSSQAFNASNPTSPNLTESDAKSEQFEYPIASYAARGQMANTVVKNEILSASFLKRAKQLAITAALALSITAALSACGANQSEVQAKGSAPSETLTETDSGQAPSLEAPTTSGDRLNGRQDYVTEENVTGPEGITEQKPGELPNGVHYDYSNYADIEKKTGKNPFAFDQDLSKYYGDEDKTIDALLAVANRTPEVLSAYANQILFDSEKAELGIQGMTMTELDDYLSNPTNEDGGELQQKIYNKLDEIFHDKENTRLTFYREYGHEQSNYIYFYDKDNNRIMTPDEMHLAQSPRQRRGEYQADMLRNNGKEFVTVADFNLPCGGQLNYVEKNASEGVPIMLVDMPDEVPTEKTDEQEDETPTTTGTSGGNNPPKDPPEDEETIIIREEELDKKNTSAERKNAGVGVVPITKETLKEDVTPKTTKTQDEANFAAIREQEAAKQRQAKQAAARAAEEAEAERRAAEEASRLEAERQQAEAAARAEAERRAATERARLAAEEAAKEEAAKEEAAKRQADKAAARAAEQAEAEAEAEAERRDAEETSAREEAQSQANEAAEEARAVAEAASTNDESRDANDWAFGAFDLGN